MRSFDLICNECRHRYHVEAEHAWVDEDKQCPECGAETVHQTLRSYLRNGPVFTEESLRNMQCKSCCTYRPEGRDEQDNCPTGGPR